VTAGSSSYVDREVNSPGSCVMKNKLSCSVRRCFSIECLTSVLDSPKHSLRSSRSSRLNSCASRFHAAERRLESDRPPHTEILKEEGGDDLCVHVGSVLAREVTAHLDLDALPWPCEGFDTCQLHVQHAGDLLENDVVGKESFKCLCLVRRKDV